MGNVGLNLLKGVGKLAISFTVGALGTFAGNALYDTFMQIKEDKERKEEEK